MIALKKDNNNKWYHLVVSIVITFLIIAKLVGGIPILPLMYSVIGYGFCIIMYLLQKPKYNLLFFVFLGLLLLSLSLADPDPVFRSEMRFGLFCLVMLVATPILSSPSIHTIREKAVLYLCWASVVLSVLSFFAFFLGINLMHSQYTDSGFVEEYESTVGGFGGLFIHSMILGPMASIASIYAFFKATRTNKLHYWFIWVLCVGAVFMSASRAALFSMGVSLFVILYSLSKTKEKRRSVVIILLLLILAIPYAGVITSRVVEKQNQREELGQGVFDSRFEKISYRMQEFFSEPIHGVGFAAIDPYGGDNYNHSTGTIEPGSSWLCVLSMSGLLGFIPFFLIVLFSWRHLGQARSSCANYLLIKGLFVFFSLHLLFEGYLLSAGNPLCMIAWLVVGCAYESNQDYFDN